VDDVLATGGTAEAAGKLTTQLGGEVVGFSFLLTLGFLEGSRRLGPERVRSLLTLP
jgi:adenine phosphoribosyltransferase